MEIEIHFGMEKVFTIREKLGWPTLDSSTWIIENEPHVESWLPLFSYFKF